MIFVMWKDTLPAQWKCCFNSPKQINEEKSYWTHA